MPDGEEELDRHVGDRRRADEGQKSFVASKEVLDRLEHYLAAHVDGKGSSSCVYNLYGASMRCEQHKKW